MECEFDAIWENRKGKSLFFFSSKISKLDCLVLKLLHEWVHFYAKFYKQAIQIPNNEIQAIIISIWRVLASRLSSQST